jgi:putative GTP pyrophosphokinase
LATAAIFSKSRNQKERNQIMSKSDQVWQGDPEKTKSQFFEQEPRYKKLCEEVEHILRTKLKDSGVEIAIISSRAKTWKSFWEKIKKEGKEYENPFEEVTDFSGARVVHLYAQDADKIEKLIHEEFKVLEIVNKIDKNGENKFGYSAIHFIVKLSKNVSGPRYDDLKDICCGIQIRTVLQDAWAIIEHHLGYKSVIPSALKRKLNGLAGLLEVADDQFEQVRSARAEYINKIANSTENSELFLENEVNKDTFFEYLKWRYESHNVTKSMSDDIFDALEIGVYKTLDSLDLHIEKANKIIKAIPPEESGYIPNEYQFNIIFLLTLVNSEFNFYFADSATNKLIQKYKATAQA